MKQVYDAGMLAGCGVFAYGAWLAWHPAGFLTAGILLAVLSFFLSYGPPQKR